MPQKDGEQHQPNPEARWGTKALPIPTPCSRGGTQEERQSPHHGSSPPALAQWPRSAIPHGFPSLSQHAGRPLCSSPPAR